MTAWDLRCGRWQTALRDVVEVDAMISDPPYSRKTHAGHNAATSNDGADRQRLAYGHLTPHQVAGVAKAWSRRTRGWIVVLTDHVLSPVWERSLEAAGRYVFAGLPIVWPGMTVRQSGDGPAREAIWMVAARPRTAEFARWGSLRGWYPAARDGWSSTHGGKPIALMEALIRDYTRPGDLVCDPFAGSGTTLIAAARMGRRCIGAESDPHTHATGLASLAKGYTPDMFTPAAKTIRSSQTALFAEEKRP